MQRAKPDLPEAYKTEFSTETVVEGFETPARPITTKRYESTGVPDRSKLETPAVGGVSKSFESTGKPDTSSFETPASTARAFAEMSTIKFTPAPDRAERPWDVKPPPKVKRTKPPKPVLDRMFKSTASKVKKAYLSAKEKGKSPRPNRAEFCPQRLPR